MKNLTCLTLLALVLAGTGLRADHQDPWMVRLRGISVEPANHSDSIPDLYLPGDVIEVSNKTMPELDLTYWFTPNCSAELDLTAAETRTVSVAYSNINSIGTVKMQTPCLMLQWRFLPGANVNPYVGIGVAETRFSDVNLNLLGSPLTLGKYNVNLALQVGLDFAITDHWFVNIDAKSIKASSDVNLQGGKLSVIDVNPMVFGVGVGVSF